MRGWAFGFGASLTIHVVLMALAVRFLTPPEPSVATGGETVRIELAADVAAASDRASASVPPTTSDVEPAAGENPAESPDTDPGKTLGSAPKRAANPERIVEASRDAAAVEPRPSEPASSEPMPPATPRTETSSDATAAPEPSRTEASPNETVPPRTSQTATAPDETAPPATSPAETLAAEAAPPESAPTDEIVAVAATEPSNALADDYRRRLRAAIVAERSYPRLARRRREEGTAVIGFRVLADGSVERLTLGASSGIASLDDAALDAVRRVGRFDPFPDAMDMAHLDISVPISFRLSP